MKMMMTMVLRRGCVCKGRDVTNQSQAKAKPLSMDISHSPTWPYICVICVKE